MFALLLGATVGAGFGQSSFTCPEDECHVAPYFMGSGGFVGMAADGVDEVTFGVTCGGVITSGEAEPNNGIVGVYLGGNYACNDEDGGKVEIRGLDDGGWYWITDAMNSAVASLVAKAALDTTAVMPTDPDSADITLTKMDGGASTLVKQASTGRVGILHHVGFLPEPEMEEMPHCMPMKSGTKWVSKETGCLMGDGKTRMAMTRTVASGVHAGSIYTLDGNSVERPTSGSITVGLGLWGNGTGRISTDSDEAKVRKGWASLPGVTATPLDADFKVRVTEVGGEKSTADLDDVGVTLTTKKLGTKKVMNVVEGAYPTGHTKETVAATVKAKAASTSDPRGQSQTNSADNADDGNTPQIENAFGQKVVDGKATGPIVYCKQTAPTVLASLDDLATRVVTFYPSAAAGTKVIHFINALDGSVVLVPDLDAANNEFDALTTKRPSITWDAMDQWVTAWNRNVTTAPIKRHRVWEQSGGTRTGAIYRELPVVACATTESEEDIRITQGMTIGLSASHCGTSTNKSVKLEIYAPLADTRTRNMEVHPMIAANGKAGSPSVNVAASNMLTITCPATSANR